jgi:hypothetical protein
LKADKEKGKWEKNVLCGLDVDSSLVVVLRCYIDREEQRVLQRPFLALLALRTEIST